MSLARWLFSLLLLLRRRSRPIGGRCHVLSLRRDCLLFHARASQEYIEQSSLDKRILPIAKRVDRVKRVGSNEDLLGGWAKRIKRGEWGVTLWPVARSFFFARLVSISGWVFSYDFVMRASFRFSNINSIGRYLRKKLVNNQLYKTNQTICLKVYRISGG